MPTTRQEIKRVLDSLEIRPSKKLGQNFLFDKNSIERLLDFAELSKDEAVVEVGPGLGAISRGIGERCESSLFVELDKRICDYLVNDVGLIDQARLLNDNILELDGADLCSKLNTKSFVLVSNVPYSISSELIFWLIKNRSVISRACLLTQKEFAQRLSASPGSRAYGSLSVLTKVYAETELGPVVKGNSFYPSAAIDSIGIKLVFREQPLVAAERQLQFEKVVRASFAKRRKTLLNSLSSAEFISDKQQLAVVLSELDIDPRRRAETLEVEEFAALTEKLSTILW